MQIDRLIQIVFLLLRHENITARQLADELCVSTRTIYRDINILSIAGVPIMSPLSDKSIRIVLKSGNFGQKDFFERALNQTRR